MILFDSLDSHMASTDSQSLTASVHSFAMTDSMTIVVSSDEEAESSNKIIEDIKDTKDISDPDGVAKDIKDESDLDDDETKDIKDETDYDDDEANDIKDETDFDDDEDMYVDVDVDKQDESEQDRTIPADTSRPINRHLSKSRQEPYKHLSAKANQHPWEGSEKRMLTMLKEARASWSKIGDMLQRTPGSCSATWQRMQTAAKQITLTSEVIAVFDQVYEENQAQMHKILRDNVNHQLKTRGLAKSGQKISNQQVRKLLAKRLGRD